MRSGKGERSLADMQSPQCPPDGAVAHFNAGLFLNFLIQHGHRPIGGSVAVAARVAFDQFAYDPHDELPLFGGPAGVGAIAHALMDARRLAIQIAFLQVVDGLAAESGVLCNLLDAFAMMQAEQSLSAPGAALIGTRTGGAG